VNARERLHLFEATGIELEYMLVDAATLAVLPECDELLHAVAGEHTGDVERGELTWSNELALHVVELKTTAPAGSLEPLPRLFQEEVAAIDHILAGLGGRLLPTAMHPWMDPARETWLWPHDHSAVYQAFDRIFDCRGHGWSNLQSVHINLPFAGDEEFARLHAAIRVLLPILPALAASSPVVEGQPTGSLDNRMEFYRTNCRRIPSVTGDVVPEPVFSQAEYERDILDRMYRDIAPHDPAGVLREEFLNARGAIARFGRGSIEIRVLDVQECPLADLAIAAAVVAALKALVEERWSSFEAQRAWPVAPLAALLERCVRDAEGAEVGMRDYARLFGVDRGEVRAGELWRRIAGDLLESGALDSARWGPTLSEILERGTLSQRILRSAAGDHSRGRWESIYRRLAECLAAGEIFV
jgi:gamma-glutamyl:cysteine ligase YbdK (ATP-grasp superfamily)